MKANGKGNGAHVAESPFAAAEELAGFLMAHAVWCVSDGSTLVPLLGYVKDGQRLVARIGAEQMQVVLPYRPAGSGRFAVHRPKFQAFSGLEGFAALGEAFFRGVNLHEHGARIWNESLDQSL